VDGPSVYGYTRQSPLLSADPKGLEAYKCPDGVECDAWGMPRPTIMLPGEAGGGGIPIPTLPPIRTWAIYQACKGVRDWLFSSEAEEEENPLTPDQCESMYRRDKNDCDIELDQTLDYTEYKYCMTQARALYHRCMGTAAPTYP
jgi:hypothetical protein